MDVKTIFAKRLKALREEKKISQDTLAKELGISRGSVSFYENGDRTADIETLEKVSKYFGVPVSYLLGYTNAKKNKNIDIGEVIGLSDSSIERLRSLKRNSPLGIKYINSIIESPPFTALLMAINSYLVERVSEDMQEKMDLLDFVEENTLTVSQKDISERGIKALGVDDRIAFDMFCEKRRIQDGIIFDSDYSLYRIQKLFANDIVADNVLSDILLDIGCGETYDHVLDVLKAFLDGLVRG